MSFLQIQMNVELTFKPIYKPLFAESFALSISNSDVKNNLFSYYFGKAGEEEIRNIFRRIVNTKYLVCIEDRCIGDKGIRGEESVLPILTNDNRKMNLKVVIA